MIKKLLNKLKTKKALSVILLAAAINIILLVLVEFKKERLQPIGKRTTIAIEKVIPGKTVIKESGQLEGYYATATNDNNNKTTVLVGENQPGKYSSVILKNNLVSYIIINNLAEFEFTNLPEFIGKYGQSDKILYGPWQESGYLSYVYLITGQIIIAHQQTNEVIEIWKIPPAITLTKLLRDFSENFSDFPKQNHIR
jgi:hypothetical protein